MRGERRLETEQHRQAETHHRRHPRGLERERGPCEREISGVRPIVQYEVPGSEAVQPEQHRRGKQELPDDVVRLPPDDNEPYTANAAVVAIVAPSNVARPSWPTIAQATPATSAVIANPATSRAFRSGS